MPNELSILIPVFNVDIRPLVRALHQQCLALAIPFEIRCYDDGSCPEILNLNKEVLSFPQTHYEILPRHLGRSDIRNLLARQARYGHLLFLDNDSRVISPDFVSKYLQALPLAPLLLGGTCYQPEKPAAPYRLHWLFGRHREEQPAHQRNQAPYDSFYLNNILVSKTVLLRFPLERLVREYGHEDSKFGNQLKKAGIPVWHLDNPVQHMGLELAAVFLQKSRQAIENLYWLYCREGLGADTKLLRVYRMLKKMRLVQLFRMGFSGLEYIILKNLQGPAPRLWLFDLYKLYWFILEERQHSQTKKPR